MRWMVICRPRPASPATSVRWRLAPSSSSDRTVSAGVTCPAYADEGRPSQGLPSPWPSPASGRGDQWLILGVFFGDDLVHRLARGGGQEALAEVGVAKQPREARQRLQVNAR